jgi:uncharacterized repeat protein (TIGR03943 family)
MPLRLRNDAVERRDGDSRRACRAEVRDERIDILGPAEGVRALVEDGETVPAERQEVVHRHAQRVGVGDFDERGAVVRMGLMEFSQRAFENDGASFNGATVQLTGFVADAERGGFRLGRYQIACCAADAAPVVVRIVGTLGDPPARDQWVTVSGKFEPGDTELPRLRATSVAEIPAPEDPYE